MITRLVALLFTSILLVSGIAGPAMADSMEYDPFKTTWERTDWPVLTGETSRTWMWGPDRFRDIISEPYAEAPGGERQVKYHDKARMEITNPDADSDSIWYVTNGLLVVELITGNMQTGDNGFSQRRPADVNVAGDADDPTGPTYATFGSLLDAQPNAVGALVTQRVDRQSVVADEAALADQGVVTGHLDEVTNHSIAAPFWEFMNSSGTVHVDGQFVHQPLFENPYFATGRPITEAYWANVKVGGVAKDVLMQCFERRCLTFTPDNPPGWQVEAGNVGQHYYSWRYANAPGDEHEDDGTVTPTPSPTPSATPSPSPTEPPVTGTPPAPSPTPEPTAEPTAETATEYAFSHAWGKPSAGIEINAPHHIAIAPNRDIYVTNTNAHQILKFAPNGELLTAWGDEGSGLGQFNSPAGIAVDSAGDIYVADFGNHRIQKFAPNGALKDVWGTTGASKGQGHFDGPWDIAISIDDVIYVTELNNNRVQSFSADGQPLDIWGALGSEDGQFLAPQGIDVATDGRVFVADTANNRIQIFDASGEWLGTSPSDTIELQIPTDIAIGDDGSLYISELGADRVQMLEPMEQDPGDGRILIRFPFESDTQLDSAFANPAGVEFADGRTYVADTANNRIQVFNGVSLIDTFDATTRGRFSNFAPNVVSVGPNDFVYTLDRVEAEIEIYTTEGEFVGQIGPQLNADVRLDEPWALAIDGSGNLYVAEYAKHLIVKLNADGDYIAQFGSYGLGDGEFASPLGVAVDEHGFIYVLDNVNRIQKFAPDFTFVASANGMPPDAPTVDLVPGLAVHDSHVYLVAPTFRDVQVFDTGLHYVSSWSTVGVAYSLSVSPDGYVFIGTSAGPIEKYSPHGELITTFGERGSASGQLLPVYGVPTLNVAFDDAGNAYVADSGNQRVQVFSPVS